jgi:thiosulfate dehydrogenase (quinone) large subunit
VIVFGELAVGIGPILGTFVGLAAAGRLLMNMAFMLVGRRSTNPALAILGVLLILAWKNAGYIGLERYLPPLLGTPWSSRSQPQSRWSVHQPHSFPIPSGRQENHPQGCRERHQ